MSIRFVPFLGALTIILLVSNIVFAVSMLTRETSNGQKLEEKVMQAVTIPDRVATNFETIKEDQMIVHRCKGIIKTVPLVSASSNASLVSYCVGTNELVYKGDDEVIIFSSTSTSADDAPYLKDVIYVEAGASYLETQSTYLIGFDVFGCMYSADSCGVGDAFDYRVVNFAFDIATKTTRSIKNYPTWAMEPVWNGAGTKAILEPMAGPGDWCEGAPLIGYDLIADEQKKITTEKACSFEFGMNVNRWSEKQMPVWGRVYWTSDTEFEATLLGADKVWSVIKKKF